jgi:hypothetical protein
VGKEMEEKPDDSMKKNIGKQNSTDVTDYKRS